MSEISSSVAAREEAIFQGEIGAHHRRTSRMFAGLMAAQWAAAIAAALVISPRTWIGDRSRVHEHVLIAIGLGGVLASLPIALALLAPTKRLTRHAIAAAQMLFSALLIHLTGGRIETHFHVFGSLAFLAFYRDWTVLLTATVVVAADHMLRGVFVPLSVFGSVDASPWRWVEHAGWVLFEDAFLVASCRRGLAEMRAISARQAGLEDAKAATERTVLERTAALAKNERALREANEGLVAASSEREKLHGQLVTASREAGRAEVATGVLHNVGNVLNSVNVSATVIATALRKSEAQNLARAADLLRERREDLGAFLSADERGKHLPGFLIEAAGSIERERKEMGAELEALQRGVEHIKQVIRLQQANARKCTVAEAVRPEEIVEIALEMQRESVARHKIEIERRFTPLGEVALDKHRVLQILNNLLSNARNAMRGPEAPVKRLTLAVRGDDEPGRVRFEVTDSGVGIPEENLAKIFALGFTTREDGHGFGLHSAATAAQEMGGALTASSAGPGHGATFTLVVPIAQTAGAPVAPGTPGNPARAA